MTNSENLFDRRLAYFVFRFVLGVNFFLHGVVRIFWTGLGKFVGGITKEFAEAPLPEFAVAGFAYFIPFAELALGLLLLLGLWTRWAAFFGGLFITALVFGTALRSDWSLLSSQMIYAAIFYLILLHRNYDFYSLDRIFFSKNEEITDKNE